MNYSYVEKILTSGLSILSIGVFCGFENPKKSVPDEGKFTLPLKYWGQLDSLFEIFSLMKVFFISEKISRS